MLIEVFLNAVYVFNDKIVISCNYKDGTKTVNFSEMESALTLRASASGSDLDCPGAPESGHPLGCPLSDVDDSREEPAHAKRGGSDGA